MENARPLYPLAFKDLSKTPDFPRMEKEILSYLNKRKGVLDGVVISGGEPMLQMDLFNFMKKVKELF